TDSRLPPLRRWYPAVLSARERFFDRQVPARDGAAQGHPDGADGEDRDADADRGELRSAGEARELRARAQPYAARTGGRMAGFGAAKLKRDLRCYHSRAGKPERQGGRMETGRGGARRSRQVDASLNAPVHSCAPVARLNLSV